MSVALNRFECSRWCIRIGFIVLRHIVERRSMYVAAKGLRGCYSETRISVPNLYSLYILVTSFSGIFSKQTSMTRGFFFWWPKPNVAFDPWRIQLNFNRNLCRGFLPHLRAKSDFQLFIPIGSCTDSGQSTVSTSVVTRSSLFIYINCFVLDLSFCTF
jgi:hypothetical protein